MTEKIIFSQTRVGQHGKNFRLYKFKSMRDLTEQEKLDNKSLKITASNNNRITKIGYFLRKTKLDELPQLYNVLKGDITLVGPRAEVEEYVDLNNSLWKKVLSIKPGITSPIAVELRYEEELLALADNKDLFYREKLLPYKLKKYAEYIDSKNFWLDMKILFQTFAALFSSKKSVRKLFNQINSSSP